jgi:hypothetical protein
MFLLRVAAYLVLSGLLVGGSLLVGMWGYAHYESLAWTDAFLNAAMLLGGMGPVHVPLTQAGKLFAGCYALYAGLVFLVSVGVGLAPVVHRALHVFHAEQRGAGLDDG